MATDYHFLPVQRVNLNGLRATNQRFLYEMVTVLGLHIPQKHYA